MTVTADPQSTPAMNGWATPQERDPATGIDRLRSERDLARAERDRVTADFESFKSQVATVGEEAARRHGWCGTYDAILDELGLSADFRVANRLLPPSGHVTPDSLSGKGIRPAPVTSGQ